MSIFYDLSFWKLVVRYDAGLGKFFWLDIDTTPYEFLGKKPPSGYQNWSKKRAGKPAGYKESGYTIIEFFGYKVRAHKLAWAFANGQFPTGMIDHINGNKSDNRIENLRLADAHQNMCNRMPFDGAMSLYLGVHHNPERGVFRAEVRTKLGLFKSKWFEGEEDAAAAYNEISMKLNGKFARLNVIGKPGETVSAAQQGIPWQEGFTHAR